MSSLCCCWRQQAAAKDGTDAAACEMEPVEVARAGESDSDCREAAMESRKLEDMVDEGRQRRLSHCAVSDGADAADEESEDDVLEDNQHESESERDGEAAESDEECSEPGAGDLQNDNNSYSRMQFRFSKHLINKISSIRKDHGLKRLLYSELLCGLAVDQFRKSRARPDDFVVMPGFKTFTEPQIFHTRTCRRTRQIEKSIDCEPTSKCRVVSTPYDCLSYTDFVGNRSLARVVVEFWASTSSETVQFWTRIPEESPSVTYPEHAGPGVQEKLQECRDQMRPILLKPSNTRMGAHFGTDRSRTVLVDGKQINPTYVVAVFGS